MDQREGYAHLLARVRVKEISTKPFLGDAYVKFGQCLFLWPYFFQVGAVLGSRHSANINEFGQAFLGLPPEKAPGGTAMNFAEAAQAFCESHGDAQTFADYTTAEARAIFGFSEDGPNLILSRGNVKVSQNVAFQQSVLLSFTGATLGAIYPQVAGEMFDRQHSTKEKDKWERARTAGLDIPAEQEVTTFVEVERAENDLFMVYCREYFPGLHTVLAAQA